jgi:hypothetical protein
MRGPKRASKIRKLFNLTKDDDVTKYVNTYRRSFESKNGARPQRLAAAAAVRGWRLLLPACLAARCRRWAGACARAGAGGAEASARSRGGHGAQRRPCRRRCAPQARSTARPPRSRGWSRR